MIYITGPGHGGPGLVANTYLEGTYSEVYPNISQDEEGMKRLFTQFSFPGGIPSHVAPETPGSIHEGGELGYALSHAYGAAFDNPDLIVACVVGDGEAETGPLATSWHSNKFLNPVHRRRRAADPAPQRLQDRQPDRAGPHQPRGARAAVPRLRLHAAISSRATSPTTMHQLMAATLDDGDRRDPAHPGRRARSNGFTRAPALADDRAAHAQGLDRPEGGRRQADRGLLARRTRCRWARCTSNPEHVRILEEWMKSYRPEELFDDDGPPAARAGRAGARGRRAA